MQIIEDRVVYSASDLNNYLDCAYLTSLDLKVLRHECSRPEPTSLAKIISQKGLEHESNYLASLQKQRVDVVDLQSTRTAKEQTVGELEADAARTEAAMAAGAPIIYQAVFFDGKFLGRSDFLERVERPCERWRWSYEVLDTKLALETKPYFIVQLCHYSEQVARIQGTPPKNMHVILGDGTRETLRVCDYDAYYRRLKAAFERDVTAGVETYPLPVDHCKICPWDEQCQARRRRDDHLNLVAWISNVQRERLESQRLTTVAELATSKKDDLPKHMEPRTFERLRLQAQLQIKQRETGVPTYELLEPREWFGFVLMPNPDPGDVFFDMEGDPLFDIGTGLEYLFGCWTPDDQKYRALWGTDRELERVAFERLVDFLLERRRLFPAAHVYHYGDYEKVALQRLGQRHQTREEEVDVLLRGEVFVNLFAVVRQALMISQESYSLKMLEPLYGFRRSAEVRKGDDSIVQFEEWRRCGDQLILDDIEAYNQEDCRSTEGLRDWLLERRLEAQVTFGRAIPLRPAKSAKELCHPVFVDGCRKCAERQRQERELLQMTETQKRLLQGVPSPKTIEQVSQLPDAVRARYLLGHLLSYHWREAKPVFWEFYDRHENADRLIERDKDCLGGLELCTEIAPYTEGRERNPRYTYRFPDQLYDVEDCKLFTPGDPEHSIGEVIKVDEETNQVIVKLSAEYKEKAQAITALIPLSYVDPDAQKVALQRIGAAFLAETIPDQSAVMDLLLSRGARLLGRSPGSRIQPDEVNADTLFSVIERLDSSTLFIQGPPGTGKSTKAGIVIARLLKAGKRIGVMSSTHKAIHNLDMYIEDAALGLGLRFKGAHKGSDSNEGSAYTSKHGLISSVKTNKEIDGGDFQFISGNAWLFGREEMDEDPLDYLFIDEAGQISLADAIAVAPCARNLVFIGDPSQLAHVSQGFHPPGIKVSVLEHLLAGAHTIPEDRGVFIDVTHRLHPTICTFISDMIYDGRLKPAPETARQRIGVSGGFGSGLRYNGIVHSGNSRASDEEAQEVLRVALALINSSITDENGNERKAGPKDIIIVTPYNAQRRLIRRLLNQAGQADIEVGTVDKFQGQQAFAVLYSTASSSAQDAPRGLDFLLDRNRFNVAISRARAISIAISSEALPESRAKDMDDMRALSLLCRYAEAALS